MSQLVNVEVISDEPAEQLESIGPNRYDYERLPEELRDQAKLAQGTIVTKLTGTVERVIDVGNTLRWAKATLPHGEYLPWVQQACGLKPKYAAQLVQAAEWASNVQHVGHLEGVTDIATLFLLSADTTPEDVREWFMERCAAGDAPGRKEVQERKRNATPGGRQRTVIQQAMSALKLSPEARELAAKAEHISTRQLMDELGVEELPKGSRHESATATFCKNGTGWWKFPAQPVVDVKPSTLVQQPTEKPLSMTSGEVLSIEALAARLGVSKAYTTFRLTPKAIKSKGDWVTPFGRIERAGRGLAQIIPLS